MEKGSFCTVLAVKLGAFLMFLGYTELLRWHSNFSKNNDKEIKKKKICLQSVQVPQNLKEIESKYTGEVKCAKAVRIHGTMLY